MNDAMGVLRTLDEQLKGQRPTTKAHAQALKRVSQTLLQTARSIEAANYHDRRFAIEAYPVGFALDTAALEMDLKTRHYAWMIKHRWKFQRAWPSREGLLFVRENIPESVPIFPNKFRNRKLHHEEEDGHSQTMRVAIALDETDMSALYPPTPRGAATATPTPTATQQGCIRRWPGLHAVGHPFPSYFTATRFPW